MFVCEYYLSDDQAEMTVPSYVNTCDEILVLAGLANEILENSQSYRRSWMTVERPLLEAFATIRDDGYYILIDTTAPPTSDGGLQYKLESCSIEQTQSVINQMSRKDIVDYYIAMYRWSSYSSEINKEGDRDLDNLRTYNDFIHEDIKFLGNCVYGTLKGYWSTGPCSQSLPYICEFYPEFAVGSRQKTPVPNSLEDFMNKLRRIRGRLKRVKTDWQLDDVGMSTEDVLMEINKLIMTSQSSQSSALHSASFTDLHSLVELTLQVVDDFQMEEKEVFDPSVFIRAISSLIDLAADAYITESAEGDIDQSPVQDEGSYYLLEYITNTTEWKVIFVDADMITDDSTDLLHFKPRAFQVEAEIQVILSEQIKQESSRVAFIYGFFLSEEASSNFEAELVYEDGEKVSSYQSLKESTEGKQFVEKENIFWLPSTCVISSTVRVNRKKVSTAVKSQESKSPHICCEEVKV